MTAAASEHQLPRVTGRHRNRALASARKKHAIELRLQGRTYRQIADEMGYASPGTVYTIIRNAQADELSSSARELRELEHARLEALLGAVWTAAQTGDLAAVRQATNIVMAESRLYGLTGGSHKKDTRADWPCCQGPVTLVVRTDDCRYEGCAEHGKF